MARGWYGFIVYDVPEMMKCVPKSTCSVDVGAHDFLTTSEGENVANPRFYQKETLIKIHRLL